MDRQRFQPTPNRTGRSRPAKLDADGLWDYALKTLSRRAHSSAELELKLRGRALESAAVSETLAKLREYGWADDRRFSADFAAARLDTRGFGPARVLRELRIRRVGATVAAEAVAEAFSGTDEEMLATQFLEKRYRGTNLPAFLAEDKNLASAYRRLRTGGFGSSVTWRVLKRYRDSVPEWEEFSEESEGETG